MITRHAILISICLHGSASLSLAETATPAPADAEMDYCRAFASKAREARFARQQQQLNELKTGIETQLLELNAKTEELKAWVERRDNIKANVSEKLVKLYSNIEAETAAAQLQKLDVELVSALLQHLNPKAAGEIMSAMETAFASKLTQSMLLSSLKAKKDKQQQ
jgi:flagellar motility protein MotE (MotC chaperone)